MKLKSIAVVDKDWGIGKDGGLLVHLPGDLKYFKEKTLNNIVIMGRTTLESLPKGKPLPERTTVIMTKNKDLAGDFYTVDSIDSLFKLLEQIIREEPEKIPYVAGGESIYKQLLPYTDTCLITKMNKGFDAEKHFENLDENPEFTLTKEGPVNSEKGVEYRFCEYVRL